MNVWSEIGYSITVFLYFDGETRRTWCWTLVPSHIFRWTVIVATDYLPNSKDGRKEGKEGDVSVLTKAPDF